MGMGTQDDGPRCSLKLTVSRVSVFSSHIKFVILMILKESARQRRDSESIFVGTEPH